MAPLKFDRIGAWTEIKLDIIRKYAAAYSRILSSRHFHHVYIDAFAGPGIHISKKRMAMTAGSPVVALNIDPPFKEYHFIDLDGDKIEMLRKLIEIRPVAAHVHQGDCNQILLEQIFPTVRYEHYRRALCLLDPYGLHLRWQVMETAGQLGTIDILLNFPVADINRNVLWHQRDQVDPGDIERMNAWWGDDSWRRIAYRTQATLFGEEQVREAMAVVVEAFRRRLQQLAGFVHVPEPLPMRNSRGAVVYYLFFGSSNQTAARIIADVFKPYRSRR
ncbi:MAG: three-Cys-motif partner protein TcmP [Candidatus Rokuibacteriota bacterium]